MIQSNLMLNKYKTLLTLKNVSNHFAELNKIASNSSIQKASLSIDSNNKNLVLSNASCNNFLVQSNLSQNVRFYSQEKKSFLGGFFEQLKEEYSKNKEMKDSIEKFREEAKKLEQSEALKEARKKYKDIEDETEKSSQVFKQKFDSITEKVKESDLGKKTAEFTDELTKQAKQTVETFSKQTQEISQTAAFKKVSENVKAIKDNIDEATQLHQVKPYQKPAKLRKRAEVDETVQAKIFESNTEATGMVLHKDSKWYQSWQNFKDNNTYVNKLFEFKTQLDESDNPLIRATRSISDKFTSVFGGMFKSTELSEVLTEIVKIEPTFEINEFLRRVQFDIIPNIMESLNQGELEILQDWCTEVAFNVLSHSLNQCKQLNLVYHNEVLDIRDLDIVASKLMDNGPVLIVRFVAQQIIYVTDSKGKVVEGEKEKIKRVHHVWALCRDPTIIDPNSAWRLMECGIHQAEDMVL